MFERFTEKAIKSIMLAQQESRRLGHNFVGTEQLLLGLIEEGTSIAVRVLKENGVTLEDTRIEVEKIISRGSGFVQVEIPFTPRAKRVLELSWDEARQLTHYYISSEHLLLGLIREGEGVAARVLENMGLSLLSLRDQVLRAMSQEESQYKSIHHKPQNSSVDSAYPMFSRFNQDAIKVIMLAQEEARRIGHNFVGTELLLLGLLGEGTGIAARALKSSGATLKQARIEVEKVIARRSGYVAVEIPFTPRARRVLEQSWEEARQLEQKHVGTEHLLLGVIGESKGVAGRVLEKMGISVSSLKEKVLALVRDEDVAIAQSHWSDPGTSLAQDKKTKQINYFTWIQARQRPFMTCSPLQKGSTAGFVPVQ
jgi:ATP-dependent Clp protease ATP-binding subunit ClpA